MNLTDMHIFITLASIMIMFKILFATEKKMQPKEQYPIKYPTEPAPEVFADILEYLDSCRTREHMKALYVKIIMFSSCYPGEDELEKDLWELYREKENEISKTFS